MGASLRALAAALTLMLAAAGVSVCLLLALPERALAFTIQAEYQGIVMEEGQELPADMGAVGFHFDHNVVTRFDENKELFYLVDEAGNEYPLEVTNRYDPNQPDDPEMTRRWIYVQPACELEPGRSYILGVRAGVEANAGTYGEYHVGFTAGEPGGKGAGAGSGDGEGAGAGTAGRNDEKGSGEETGGGKPDAEEPAQSKEPSSLQETAETHAADAKPQTAKPAASLATAYRLVGGIGGTSGEGEAAAAKEESAAMNLPLLMLIAMLCLLTGAAVRASSWRRHVDQRRGGADA